MLLHLPRMVVSEQAGFDAAAGQRNQRIGLDYVSPQWAGTALMRSKRAATKPPSRRALYAEDLFFRGICAQL